MRDKTRQIETGARKAEKRAISLWQKALLLSFGFLLIVLMEVGLRVVGYGKPSEREDPFVGFEKVYPLFGVRKLPDGRAVYATNPNKRAFFNEQTFPVEKPAGTFRIFCFGGSTTFGRPYEAPTAFPRWLEIGLNGMAPTRNFEVINAGGVSYASYRIVNLVEEMVRYEPDLFVIYTGHNEFLESRTYEEILRADPAVTRVRTTLGRLRIYTLVQQAVMSAKGLGEKAHRKFTMKGEVDAVLDHVGGLELYRRNDVQKQATLEHFRYNLRRIVDIARDSGVDLLFIAPVSNIRDFSPFKSEHAEGLSPEARERWEALYRRGISLSRAGDCPAALDAFQGALEIDREYADLHYRIAGCYDALGRYDEAGAHYIRARDLDICPLRATGEIEAIVREVAGEYRVPLIDLAPVFEARSDHGLLGREWFLDHVHPTVEGHRLIADEIAQRLVDSGTVVPEAGWSAEKRDALYGEAMASLNDGYFALKDLNLGKVLTWAGKYREALDPLERAAGQSPGNVEVPRLLGQVYAALGQPGKAAGEFRLAIRGGSDDPKLHNDLGNAYAAQADYGRAVEAYETAIRLSPDNAEAHYNLGNAYAAQADYGKAVEAYRAAVRLHPDNADIWNNLGNAHRAQGEDGRAIEAYRKALQIAPEDAEAHYNLGKVYADRKAYGEAEDAFQTSLRLSRADPKADPRFIADIHFSLGVIYRAQEALDRAISAYQAALELNPDDARICNNLGNIYSVQKEYDRAISAYRDALRFNPDDLNAHYNLGFIYGVRKEYTKAAAEYEAVLRVDPEDVQAHYRLAFAYAAQGNYNRAIAHYQEVIGREPNRPEVYGNLGLAYLKSGDRQKAAVAFGKVLEIDPGNDAARRYLSRLSGY